MKKVLYGIIILCITFVLTSKVYASSYELELDGNEIFDNEINLILKIKSLNGFDTGLYGLSGRLDYNKSAYL